MSSVNQYSLTSFFLNFMSYFGIFPGGSEGEESTRNAGDLGSIPGLGRSPGGGNGNPLQYSCLENPMERGAWRATVHGVARVGHDFVTTPPPPVIELGSCSGSVVKNLPAMQESQEMRVQSLGQEGPLEKKMATHSNILAWEIPWTEEPGGLLSVGSQE